MIDENNKALSVGASSATHAADMRETAQTLELAIAQIGMSLHESDHAVETLIGAITTMSGCVRRIEEKLDASCDSPQSITLQGAIYMECQHAKESMQQAVTAFRFYDLLSQRLLHIEENLKAVAGVMRAPDQQHSAMWQQLHDRLCSVYSLEQEQPMYQALLLGLSGENVIEPPYATTRKSCGDDIELF
jgi:hypothetical protein